MIKTLDLADLPSDVVKKYQSLLIKLPESKKLYKIIIQFVRPANVKTGGVSLDDLFVQPCSEFSKYVRVNLTLGLQDLLSFVIDTFEVKYFNENSN